MISCSNELSYTGNSFLIIKIALIATTLFLILENKNVDERWNTSLNVSALVTFIAAIHYHYMSNHWIKCLNNPISIRYIDWFLTVPLQILEFYLILKIHNKIPGNLLYKLLLPSIFMLVFGYLGETNLLNRSIAFLLGMICWIYILYNLYFGEASIVSKNTKDESVKFVFKYLKLILLIGWSIYPIGYIFHNNLNIIYNFGDLINKIMFALIIWYGAKNK